MGLSKKDAFLIEEYKAASKLTFHIDELRNKLTSFFLSFAAIIVGLITFFLEDKLDNLEVEKFRWVAFIMFFVSFIGFIMVCILGKLRRVQF